MRVGAITRTTPEAVSGNILVLPGHVQTGQANDILYTRGVGACIEVCVYDAATRIGHMAHVFSTQGSQLAAFTQLEQHLERYGNDNAELQAWLRGGSSEAKLAKRVEPEYLLRNSAVEKLRRLGIKPNNVSVEWNDDETTLLSSSLRCATGEHRTVATHFIR